MLAARPASELERADAARSDGLRCALCAVFSSATTPCIPTLQVTMEVAQMHQQKGTVCTMIVVLLVKCHRLLWLVPLLSCVASSIFDGHALRPVTRSCAQVHEYALPIAVCVSIPVRHHSSHCCPPLILQVYQRWLLATAERRHLLMGHVMSSLQAEMGLQCCFHGHWLSHGGVCRRGRAAMLLTVSCIAAACMSAAKSTKSITTCLCARRHSTGICL